MQNYLFPTPALMPRAKIARRRARFGRREERGDKRAGLSGRGQNRPGSRQILP